MTKCTCGEARFGYPHTKECVANQSTQQPLDEWIEEWVPPDAEVIRMDGFDEAAVGVAIPSLGTGHAYKMIYDYEAVIEINMKAGMSREAAEEFFEFNQGGAYVGESTPIFMRMK